MLQTEARKRPGCECVFVLLRMLLLGHELWGARSAIGLAELSALLDTGEARLGALLTYLSGEGLVAFDRAAGTVRLTEEAARHLLRHRSDRDARA